MSCKAYYSAKNAVRCDDVSIVGFPRVVIHRGASVACHGIYDVTRLRTKICNFNKHDASYVHFYHVLICHLKERELFVIKPFTPLKKKNALKT